MERSHNMKKKMDIYHAAERLKYENMPNMHLPVSKDQSYVMMLSSSTCRSDSIPRPKWAGIQVCAYEKKG